MRDFEDRLGCCENCGTRHNQENAHWEIVTRTCLPCLLSKTVRLAQMGLALKSGRCAMCMADLTKVYKNNWRWIKQYYLCLECLRTIPLYIDGNVH